MTTQYILAPNGRWSAFDQTGFAAIGGQVYTFENTTRIPKTTYQDPAGLLPNTNPIVLDARGEANIYWADDDFYTIEVYAASGELLYSQDNYPNVASSSGGGDIIISELNFNLVRNAQFTAWGNSNYLNNANNVSFTRLGTDDVICNDWKFRRSNTNATVSISQQNFAKGQSDVPSNPISYLNYQCTGIGAGSETYKDIYQIYQSAQFLSNSECAIGVWASSTIGDTIIVRIEQFFGTGGSPSTTVVTEVLTTVLTTDWAQYTGTITIPSVSGKNFGTNGDDHVAIVISLPLNAISNISLANIQFHGQNTLPSLPKLPPNDQLKRMDSVVDEGVFTTGDFVLSIAPSKGNGWIMCNDQTIGSSFSNASYASNSTFNLYNILWNNVNPIYCPVYDSSGVPVTRGISAIADFNADRKLSLTKVLGRALGASGTYSGTMTFTADASTNILTLPDATSFYTGTPIKFTTTGVLPAPLNNSTVYYAILFSATTIAIAATVENAIAGINIDLTTAGSGINNVFLFDTNYFVTGQFVGEDDHNLISTEIPPITSSIDLYQGGSGSITTPVLHGAIDGIGDQDEIFYDTSIGHYLNRGFGISASTNTGTQAHNNLQPTIFTNCFFKL